MSAVLYYNVPIIYNLGKFAASVVDNGGKLPPVYKLTPVARYYTPAIPVAKFAVSVVNTSGNFATGVIDTGGAHLLAYLCEFSKKFEMILMLFSGTWGK